jgi:hypothetical protein
MSEEYSLDDLYDIAQGLVDWYADRNTMFKNMDDMFYKRWTMPEGVPEWVLKVVSTDPHDAILTTIRTFSTLNPHFKVAPMINNEANRDRANQIETALSYNFRRAGRRNDASVTWDIMMSAALYSETAAQVVYLPYQEKVLKAMGKDTKRVQAAKRFGDFVFIVHNPANIYPEWSEYGLEGVLAVRVQTVDEFMATWGELANKIVDMKEYNDGKITYVTSYDYTTYEKRCVWGVCTDLQDMQIRSASGIKILEEENKLGFIPYVCQRWGNSLSTDPKERVMPLLASIYDSGQWDMLNVFESLDASLTMKRAAQPQFAGEFPPGQEPVLDNTEPVGVTKLPQGTRQFTPLPAQTVDGRVENQKQGFRSNIWQSSVSRVLTTLETGNRESYSSFNQRLTAASNSLAPQKIIGEKTHAELAHQMLCWIKYYGKEYGKVDLVGRYDDKTRMGEEVRIDSDTIDPDVLEIEVTLTADLPIDKLQQINGAVLLKQNFRVPEEELVEDLVGGDPSELAKRRNLEDYKNAYIQADIKRIMDAEQLETQQKMMEMQAGIQQQQQAQAAEQEAAARQQEQAQADAANNATPAQGAMEGMTPNMGGMPPVQMARNQRG